ncbi:hypothetical protein CMsap09_05480 [Clavibacter michiganensis]|uniref:Uncharacterized protein n=1 Tax=Clavibacter michiganensis TaxID=28447 RepID=A0A251XSW5_9MICO|nr:hypothetical protein CMsap09_05480 [Clavibacter michiganensis]
MSWNTWPPNETVRPASVAARAESLSASSVASVTWSLCPRNCTVVMATVPSSETASVAYSENGESAVSTPGTSPAAVAVASMAACSAASVTSAPAGASVTICALAPAACGNTAARRSMASWDSVPGIEKDSWVFPPSARPPPRRMPRTRIHAATTRHGWRNEIRPSRYRSVAMGGGSPYEGTCGAGSGGAGGEGARSSPTTTTRAALTSSSGSGSLVDQSSLAARTYAAPPSATP